MFYKLLWQALTSQVKKQKRKSKKRRRKKEGRNM